MNTTTGYPTKSKQSGDYKDQRLASQGPVLIPDDTDCCKLLAADVLCGRERASPSHLGNRRFRQMIVMKREAYQKALSQNERMSVIEDVITMVKESGGRFLRRNPKTGQLEELEDGSARELVQRAFQYVAKKVIPKIPERTQAPMIRAVSEEKTSDDESMFQTILSDQRKIFQALMKKEGLNVSP